MKEYIPYSTRLNVTNKPLWGLIDFLERYIGWDNLSMLIDEKTVSKIKGTSGTKQYEIQIGPENITFHESWSVIILIPKNVFFWTYTSILPYYK